ncbi:MAG: UTRA domain-containing protein, partial [Streptomyces sp.]|nr:UTRA domain-containing protein [Streptomyces sp.]
LSVPEGSEVTALERLRLTHGQPVALLGNYLPTGLLHLDSDRLEATGLYRMLRTAGITLHSARQTIGARSATAEEAARLDEQTGAAVLTMQRTAYDDTGRPVEYGTHIYRASRYAFDFRLLVRP